MPKFGAILSTFSKQLYLGRPEFLYNSSNVVNKTTLYVQNVAPLPTFGRSMSMWPSGFEDPVKHKKDFPELKEKGEYQTKALSPIKSTPNYATCSLFKDPLVQKFHRLCTVHGRSEQAENNLRETYRLIKRAQLKKYYKVSASINAKSKQDSTVSEQEDINITTDPVLIIKRAIENARPLMALEKVKVGSVEYLVPKPITVTASQFRGMKWIIEAARDRDKLKSSFKEKLAEILVETASFTGRVVQQKNDHHKTCELNRAYAHYRRTK